MLDFLEIVYYLSSRFYPSELQLVITKVALHYWLSFGFILVRDFPYSRYIMGSSCMKPKRWLPGGPNYNNKDKARSSVRGQSLGTSASLRPTASTTTIIPSSNAVAAPVHASELVELHRTDLQAGASATGKELLPSSSAVNSRFASMHPWNNGGLNRRGGKVVIFEISDFYPPFKSQCQLAQRSHIFKETQQLTKLLRAAGVAALQVEQNSTTDEVRDVMARLATDSTMEHYNCLVCVILTRGVLTLVRTTPDIGDDFLPFYDGYLRRSELIDPLRKSPYCTKIPVLFMFEGMRDGWLSDPLDVNNVALLMPTTPRT